MRGLLLGDYRKPSTIVPLARSRTHGVELQSFSAADDLERPGVALAEHHALLAGFSGLLAVHGPYADLNPGSDDRLIREVTAERFRQALAVAKELAATHVILHDGYFPQRSAAGWINRSCSFWSALLDQMPDSIHVHIENAADPEPDVLLELVERVADARFGICLDIGHAHESETAVTAWAQATGPRVSYVHLHDNHGHTDEHLPLGQGNLPLVDTLAILEERAPNALWSIEADVLPSLAWLAEQGLIAAGP